MRRRSSTKHLFEFPMAPTTTLTARATVTAITLMLAAMMFLPFLDVCAKFLGRQGVPVIEIVWARMAFGTLLTLPFALKAIGLRGLTPANPLFHFARASFLIAATGFFFWALHFLPI